MMMQQKIQVQYVASVTFSAAVVLTARTVFMAAVKHVRNSCALMRSYGVHNCCFTTSDEPAQSNKTAVKTATWRHSRHVE